MRLEDIIASAESEIIDAVGIFVDGKIVAGVAQTTEGGAFLGFPESAMDSSVASLVSSGFPDFTG